MSNKGCPSFFERASAANKYYNANNNLPPTYSMEKYGVKQFIPDPETPASIAWKLEAVRKAEENLNDVNERYKQCKAQK